MIRNVVDIIGRATGQVPVRGIPSAFRPNSSMATLDVSSPGPEQRRKWPEAISEHVSSLRDGAGPRTLLAVGLTCHSMLDPALDRLWKTQASLVPLVRTLPADAWTHFGKNIVTLTRPLVHADWQRFDAYALRVRELGFTRGDARHPVNLAVLDAFAAHHPGAPLLPRLRRLRLTTHSRRFLDLLFVPCLTSVSFDFGLCWRLQEERALVAAVLEGAQGRCPYLDEFLVDRVPGTDRGGASSDAFAALLPRHQDPPNLLVDDIIRLAAVPRLRRAAFRVHSVLDVPLPSHVQHFDAFPSLQVLRLHVRSLEIFTALLRLLQTPYLEALSILVDEHPDPSTLYPFFTELQSLSSPSTFRSLTLYEGADVPSELTASNLPAWTDRPAIDGRVLAPLLSLPGMRVLEINLSLRYQLCNEDILHMAVSWPALEHLSLGAQCGWGHPFGVSLAGLRGLIACCPQLRFCGIPLDLSRLPADAARADARVCNRQITKLFLADTPVREDICEAGVAMLLSLLPSLEGVVAWGTHLSSDPDIRSAGGMMTPQDVALRLTSRIAALHQAGHANCVGVSQSAPYCSPAAVSTPCLSSQQDFRVKTRIIFEFSTCFATVDAYASGGAAHHSGTCRVPTASACMVLASTYACFASHAACELQACLNKNTYKPEKCEEHMRNLYMCCQAMYEQTGERGESTACPMPSVVRRWLKNHGENVS
ncbi:hypothetical protein DAEQUDRAFT_755211 [Daedalea quercina L-15889]|uniref:Cx9C motif-containing protein 4, mitochondrial n=1 Tax=Daedalea quercina L-15889 TaxID=1314783 RepID=A0A165SRF9_9APHY|nr:hypothetical protein DAEQUDRAFT_755211 [Daedalea quercina L-15889]